MPETELKDGFAIKAKCAGDYTTAGYVLEVDFESEDEARDWLWDLLHAEDPENVGTKWLVLEDGGALNLSAVAVLQIVPAKVSRELVYEKPVRGKGRRETEDTGDNGDAT
jgi:hypothetical protein